MELWEMTTANKKIPPKGLYSGGDASSRSLYNDQRHINHEFPKSGFAGIPPWRLYESGFAFFAAHCAIAHWRLIHDL
jgi:hypothetical protein